MGTLPLTAPKGGVYKHETWVNLISIFPSLSAVAEEIMLLLEYLTSAILSPFLHASVPASYPPLPLPVLVAGSNALLRHNNFVISQEKFLTSAVYFQDGPEANLADCDEPPP